MEIIKVAAAPSVNITAGTFGRNGAERQAFLLATELANRGLSVTVTSFQPKPRGSAKFSDISCEFPEIPVTYLRPWFFRPARFIYRIFSRVRYENNFSTLADDAKSPGLAKESTPSRLLLFFSWMLAPLYFAKIGGLLAGLMRFRLQAGIETVSLIRWVKNNDSSLLIGFLTNANAVISIAGLATKVPVVVSERNDVEKGPQPDMVRWLRLNCYPHAELITANTQFAATQLQSMLPAKSIAWQPNKQSFPPPNLPLRDLSFDLNVVSRLAPHKRVHGIVEALAILHKFGHRLTLNIYGEGPEEATLRTLARRTGLAEHVKFHGYVPMSDIYGVERAPGIYVTNSEYEGSSNSLHEAVANGFLPVIADTVGEAFDILREPLMHQLITDGSPRSIAEKIKSLVESELAVNVQEQVAEDFAKYWEFGRSAFREFIETCELLAAQERTN